MLNDEESKRRMGKLWKELREYGKQHRPYLNELIEEKRKQVNAVN